MSRTRIFIILIIAFLFRFVLLLIDNFWFRLPQGGDDTERFQRWAMEMINNGFPDFLDIISSGVTLYSYFGAIVFTFFGNKPIFWGLLNVLFGVGTVYNVYRICILMTNNIKVANRAAWIIALYPNIAILSALILREAPIHFFLSLSVVYLVKYINNKNILSLVFFLLYALIASILHSAVIMVFGGFVVGYVLFNDKISVFNKIIVVFITVLGIYIINTTGIGLSKFGGSFESALEKIEEGIGGKGNAIYPQWLLMTGGLGDLWKLPIRIVAFLGAPLIPFMVKSANHILGVIDATVYVVLFYFIIKKRFLFKAYKVYSIIFCIIFTIVIGFSFGSSNFGTNIRHRAKVLPLITVLGATASLAKLKNKKNERKNI